MSPGPPSPSCQRALQHSLFCLISSYWDKYISPCRHAMLCAPDWPPDETLACCKSYLHKVTRHKNYASLAPAFRVPLNNWLCMLHRTVIDPWIKSLKERNWQINICSLLMWPLWLHHQLLQHIVALKLRIQVTSKHLHTCNFDQTLVENAKGDHIKCPRMNFSKWGTLFFQVPKKKFNKMGNN